MNRKILVVGMIGLSLSLLVACGDKTKTQEPSNETDQSAIQQSEPQAQPMEVKQEIPAESKPTETAEPEEPANQEEASTEDDTLDEIDLFTEVEETVYAISTVNIRASWSTDSDKLGSLTSGDSLTRIGIGIAGTEAEVWSKVVLSDGSIAYVGSSYLSTTKPATQQQTQQTQAPQQQQGQSSSGGGGVTLADLGITLKDGESSTGKPADDGVDWSKYTSTEGYHSTGEQMEKSWENVIVN